MTATPRLLTGPALLSRLYQWKVGVFAAPGRQSGCEEWGESHGGQPSPATYAASCSAGRCFCYWRSGTSRHKGFP